MALIEHEVPEHELIHLLELRRRTSRSSRCRSTRLAVGRQARLRAQAAGRLAPDLGHARRPGRDPGRGRPSSSRATRCWRSSSPARKTSCAGFCSRSGVDAPTRPCRCRARRCSGRCRAAPPGGGPSAPSSRCVARRTRVDAAGARRRRPGTSRTTSTSSSRPGRIRVASRGRLRARPFLDIRRLVLAGGEQGLLSVAFHPRYARNRRFYVNYTDRNGDTRVVEYRSRGLSRSPVTVRQIFFVGRAVPEPQRRPARVRSGRLPLRRDGRRRLRRRPGEPRAESGSPLGKMLRFNVNERRPQPVIVGYGAAQPLAFLVRPAERATCTSATSARTPGRRSTTRRAEPGARELRLARLRGQAALLERGAEQRGAARHALRGVPNPPKCSVIGGFVYRGSAVPSAKGRYFFSDNCAGRVRSVAAQGRDVGAATSRSASTGAPRSARTPAASSTSRRSTAGTSTSSP